MSRLDSAIRRLEAQRACLDLAMSIIVRVAGPAFELGLGNGRTYDHLRERIPGRDIYVFERSVAAHPDCIPPDDRLFLGDLRATLPAALPRFGGAVALIHADIGSGDAQASGKLAAELAPTLGALLAPGGVLAADRPVRHERLVPTALPSSIPQERYFLYRAR